MHIHYSQMRTTGVISVLINTIQTTKHGKMSSNGMCLNLLEDARCYYCFFRLLTLDRSDKSLLAIVKPNDMPIINCCFLIWKLRVSYRRKLTINCIVIASIPLLPRDSRYIEANVFWFNGMWNNWYAEKTLSTLDLYSICVTRLD